MKSRKRSATLGAKSTGALRGTTGTWAGANLARGDSWAGGGRTGRRRWWRGRRRGGRSTRNGSGARTSRCTGSLGSGSITARPTRAGPTARGGANGNGGGAARRSS